MYACKNTLRSKSRSRRVPDRGWRPERATRNDPRNVFGAASLNVVSLDYLSRRGRRKRRKPPEPARDRISAPSSATGSVSGASPLRERRYSRNEAAVPQRSSNNFRFESARRIADSTRHSPLVLTTCDDTSRVRPVRRAQIQTSRQNGFKVLHCVYRCLVTHVTWVRPSLTALVDHRRSEHCDRR